MLDKRVLYFHLVLKSQAAHICHQTLFVIFFNLSMKNAVGSRLVSKVTQAKLRYLVFTMPRRALVKNMKYLNFSHCKQTEDSQFSFFKHPRVSSSSNSNVSGL